MIKKATVSQNVAGRKLWVSLLWKRVSRNKKIPWLVGNSGKLKWNSRKQQQRPQQRQQQQRPQQRPQQQHNNNNQLYLPRVEHVTDKTDKRAATTPIKSTTFSSYCTFPSFLNEVLVS